MEMQLTRTEKRTFLMKLQCTKKNKKKHGSGRSSNEFNFFHDSNVSFCAKRSVLLFYLFCSFPKKKYTPFLLILSQNCNYYPFHETILPQLLLLPSFLQQNEKCEYSFQLVIIKKKYLLIIHAVLFRSREEEILSSYSVKIAFIAGIQTI